MNTSQQSPDTARVGLAAAGPVSTVIEGAHAIYFDASEPPLRNGWLLVDGGIVQASGEGPPPAADERVDARGMIVLPGLICAHHHLFQGLSRGVETEPGNVNWLARHYRAWSHLDADFVSAAAELSIAQLLRSGCTTVATLEYLHPPGEDFATPVIDASAKMGIRLLYVRGTTPMLENGMQDSLAAAGVRVERLIEEPDRAIDAIASFLVGHQPSPMLRYAIGPTTPFLDDGGAFHAALNDLALLHNTHLHLHLHPLRSDGLSGFDFARTLGLVRKGNWFAHGSNLSASDVAQLGSAGVGIVHCPSCSHLLGYPLPPLRSWTESNDRVCVAVDGAASNDGGSLLYELALTYYSQLHRWGRALSSETMLSLVTSRAARAIGWPGVGNLKPGSQADVAAFRLDGLEGAGNVPDQGDPLIQLLRTCRSEPAALTIVGGRAIVVDGELTTCELSSVTKNALVQAARGADWYDTADPTNSAVRDWPLRASAKAGG